jgi:hypothetical protein
MTTVYSSVHAFHRRLHFVKPLRVGKKHEQSLRETGDAMLQRGAFRGLVLIIIT